MLYPLKSFAALYNLVRLSLYVKSTNEGGDTVGDIWFFFSPKNDLAGFQQILRWEMSASDVTY